MDTHPHGLDRPNRRGTGKGALATRAGLLVTALVLLWGVPSQAEVGGGPLDHPPDFALLLIRDELVHKELDLRPGQVERIQKILADHDDKIWALHQQPPKTSAAALRGILDRLERRLSAVLTSEQEKRFTQIALQFRGTFGMLSPAVVRQLKLTADEQKKVAAAAQEGYESRMGIAAGDWGDEPGTQAAAYQQAKANEEEQLREAIGPERLQAWFGIIGRPFAVDKLRPPSVRAPELRPETTWVKGAPTTLAALRGQVVLLHFWSAACDRCTPNYPIIARWADELKSRGLTVIGVRLPTENVVVGTNGTAPAAPDAEMNYLVAADDAKATWQAWASPTVPTAYLIDRRGCVRYWWAGELDALQGRGESFLRQRIEVLLAEH